MVPGGGYGRKFLLWLLVAPLLGVLALSLQTSSPAAPALALDDQETAFLDMINQYRAASGLGSLSVNAMLTDSARWMAQDMAAENYFSHTDSLGRDPFDRMDTFGYTYNTWRGENLAAGIDDAQRAMDLWQGSPGHNANMLNANYTVIGIARAFGPTSAFTWYWATEFGGQADPPPAPAPPPPPPPAPAPEPAPYVPPAEPEPPAPAPPPAPEPAQTPTPVVAGQPELAPTAQLAPEPSFAKAVAWPHPWWHAARAGWPWHSVWTDGGHGSFLRAFGHMADALSSRRSATLLRSRPW
ncbi:MAG: CAP domain-containing protein [Dehalococcoidia bacterium]|nr:CAP domain-containing protein [Dehalococcoidia bacterium]